MRASLQKNLQWWIAVNLAFCAAINYADRSALSAVLPSIRSEMHLSDVQLASLGSVFLWSYALFSPLAGNIGDRWSRSKLVVISVGSWSLIAAASGFATNYPTLLLTRILLGMAECLYLPCATALLASYHGQGSRGTAMAIHSVGLNLGVIAGGAGAGWFADRFSWRFGFIVLGVCGIVIAMVSSLVLRDSMSPVPVKRDGQPVLTSVRQLARIPSYLNVLLEVMLVAIGVWTFFNWLPLYFRDTFHLSLSSAGFAGTFGLQIAAVIGMAASGYWSDRLAKRSKRNRMLLQGLSFLGAAPFLLVFLLPANFTIANAGILGFALCRGFGQANDNPILCDVVPPPIRGTAIGIMNTCACFAGGLGVIAAGAMKQRLGLNGFFALNSLAFVSAGAVLLGTYRFWLNRDLERNAGMDV